MRLRSAQGSGVRAATILLVASLVSTAAGLADSHADLLRAHQAFHNALRDADSPALLRLLDDHFTWTHT